ncbi:MAG: carboxylating nicotinate-nucleotide diphosphorylase [bacterium]|nr:carboxylating nicotinate-nucleotide diphosphorylase [bacterium]
MDNTEALVRCALEEDGAWNDVTSAFCGLDQHAGQAQIIARESGVFCGSHVISAILDIFNDTKLAIQPIFLDGDAFKKGDVILRLSGPATTLLALERTLLNFLQRLCGIASTTKAYVNALSNSSIAVLDTRKTTPGLRPLERKAVVAGGGKNHRYNLSDMVLLKENHLAALAAAGKLELFADTCRAFKHNCPGIQIEIEVETLAQLGDLGLSEVDIIMLDNFALEDIPKAKAICEAKEYGALLEVSGNISLETISQYRTLPVDRISIGKLTHSVKALDLSMLMEDA